jgi:hypothetical protein
MKNDINIGSQENLLFRPNSVKIAENYYKNIENFLVIVFLNFLTVTRRIYIANRGRCFDFLNIFAKKIGVVCSKYC